MKEFLKDLGSLMIEPIVILSIVFIVCMTFLGMHYKEKRLQNKAHMHAHNRSPGQSVPGLLIFFDNHGGKIAIIEP